MTMRGKPSSGGGGGRTVCEARPDGPAWAANVLDTAQSVDPNLAEVVQIAAAARDPAERRRGHDAFQSARQRYLAEECGPQRSLSRTTLLRLAALVAKAAYDDTGLPAPFDAHAPWRIGPCAVQLAAIVGRVWLRGQASRRARLLA